MRAMSPKKAAEKRRMAKLRGELFVRDNGCCVVCGGALAHGAWHPHHRVLEGQGGRAELCNIICVHFDCHVPVIHANPDQSKANGWIVPNWLDPSEVPVLYADGTRRKLTNEPREKAA